MNKCATGVFAIAASLALAACGDTGSGGMASTPPPAATYTKIADMTGNRTFQTAGVTYTSNLGAFSNLASNAFGSGTTIAYTSATDSYTLTGPGGSPTQTFGPNDIQGQPVTSVTYSKTSGNTAETLVLTPSVALSYAVFGSWVQRDTVSNIATVRLAVGGSPTLASDMPKTGSATYNLGLGGSANSNGVNYSLSGNSTGSLAANFATGSVNATINLGGTTAQGGPVTALGTFTGTGTIASGGPGYTGNLTGTPGAGVFSGAFFGPQAQETALNYVLAGTNFNAGGQGGGVKQ